MPADDLVLNVRQIANYPAVSSAAPSDSVLLQRGGIGGPYASISPSALVATALSTGGDLTIGGGLLAASVQAGSAQFSNAAVNALSSQQACFRTMNAEWGSIAGVPIATTAFASGLVAGLQAATVWSFNGRRGDVSLWIQDIVKAGGAPIWSPFLQGTPMAPTPGPSSCSDRLATTAFVWRNSGRALDDFVANHPLVFTFNGRSGDVVLTPEDIGNVEGALLNSPALQGVPTAPTAPPGTNTDQLATCAFVTTAIANAVSGLSGIYAPLNSPQFSGQPTAPTANPGTATAQLATCAFVQAAIVESTTGVSSWNGRTGAVNLGASDIVNADGALLNSPIFTGTPQAPSPGIGDNSNRLATTGWVLQEIGGANVGVMSFNGRGGAVILNTTDITGAGGAPLVSAQLSGVPTAPTAPTGTADNTIATCAFVADMVNAGSVVSFNGRTGAVTLTNNDISAAGGLANPSAAMTGTPTAPTAVAGTQTNQVATCAFVAAAILAAGGVTSFNGRSGAITLSLNDVTTAFAASSSLPLMDGTAAVGTMVAWSRGDHVHPSDTSRASVAALANYLPLTGGSLTGQLTVNGNVMLTGSTSNLSIQGQWIAANTANASFSFQTTASSGPTANLYANDIFSQNGNFVAVPQGTNNSNYWLANSQGQNRGVFFWQASNQSVSMTNLVGSGQLWITSDGASWSGGTMNAPFFQSPGQGWGPAAIIGIGGGSHNVSFEWASNTLYFHIDGTAGQGIQVISDYRTKKDIAPLASMWAKVKALNPIRFTRATYSIFTADEVERWGFTAHELQTTLIDSAASGYKDDPKLIQSPDILTLLASLTKALQEAMGRIETLEAKA